MIVQPDFLDHWKTCLLCDLLNDTAAPLYVIRLWAHCQNRKTHRLQRTNMAMLKAICKAPQDADAFERAMLEAGFIEIESDEIIAHDWDEANASLIASWHNGRNGGRPRMNKPPKTHGYPKDNPKQTQGEPMANPDETDKRRVDREEKIRGENTSCAKPHGDSTQEGEAVLVFPCTGPARQWLLTEQKLTEWSETYNTLDVEAQVRLALQWIKDNPSKRKTAQGMPRFLGNWLSNAANNPRTTKTADAYQPKPIITL
ncbi:MAG: hypothetical protein JXR25_11085 [Pontiellaceae bacterium]|nr:hypothetical protein [Pontiellaceae bacterium]